MTTVLSETVEGTVDMNNPSFRVPPKDRALEGIQWLVRSHGLRAGDRLPAERELCEAIGVSRTALRSAISQLVTSGYLESRHGSGTYVCPRKPLNLFQEKSNYTTAVLRAGRMPSTRLLDARMCKAGDDSRCGLELSDDAPVYMIKRLRLVDGNPAAIETTYVNYSLCGGIEAHDFATEHLYQVLDDEYGVKPRHGLEQVSIVRLTDSEAHLLGSRPGDPAYHQRTAAYDAEMAPIESCQAVILPDHYRFADNGEPHGCETKVGMAWLMS